jgi:glycosyltransferase involved in cell wall biosynthesis
MNKKISLILPARDVADIVQSQLDEICQLHWLYEIIVVSNQSQDYTYEKVLEYAKIDDRVKILRADSVDKNGIGYGYAIQAGFAYATGDYIFKADFDGTYPIALIESFVDSLIAENKQIALTSRFPLQKDSYVPLFNRIGIWVLNFFFLMKNGVKIDDVLCGLYGGQAEAIRKMNLIEGGWNFSIAFKLKTMQQYKESVKQFNIKQKEKVIRSHQQYFQTFYTHLMYILFN